MTRIDLKKKEPARPQRRHNDSFWDGFFLFAFLGDLLEGCGELLGAIFEGLGSN